MSILFFFFFFFNDTATTEIYTLSLHDALPISVTDEPGLYLAGRFGVRIENTLLIKPYKETAFGRFLQMESLTLCPIDTAPIDRSLLTSEEITWLNDYHQSVFDRLSPLLDEPERQWLDRKSTR